MKKSGHIGKLKDGGKGHRSSAYHHKEPPTGTDAELNGGVGGSKGRKHSKKGKMKGMGY